VILVDSSVWIDHIAAPEPQLLSLLNNGDAISHPLVIGEIALGHIRNRSVILGQLDKIVQAVVASDAEVRELIERRKLHGKGIGYIDAHLLASAMLTPKCFLWTRDRHLRVIADAIGVSAKGYT
jgi:predicted nucleic acid-binding protein